MFNVSPPGRCGPPQCVNDLTPLLSFVDDDVLARAVNFKAIYTLTELNASPTHLRFSEPLSGTTPSHLPYLLVSVYVIILREPFHSHNILSQRVHLVWPQNGSEHRPAGPASPFARLHTHGAPPSCSRLRGLHLLEPSRSRRKGFLPLLLPL